MPVLLGKDVFQTSEALNLALLVETKAQRKRREAAQKRGEEERDPPFSIEEVHGTTFDDDLLSHRARLTRAQKGRNKQQYCAILNNPEESSCGENTSIGDEEPRREEKMNDPPRQVTPPTVLQATPEEIRQ